MEFSLNLTNAAARPRGSGLSRHQHNKGA